MNMKLLGSLAALSLLGASNAALAQSAAPLSISNSPTLARAGADAEGASDLRGGRWILAAVVLGLLVWGAIELFGDNDEAFPVSP